MLPEECDSGPFAACPATYVAGSKGNWSNPSLPAQATSVLKYLRMIHVNVEVQPYFCGDA